MVPARTAHAGLHGTALTLAALLAVAGPGCGSSDSTPIVTGRIVRGGQPLKVRGRESGVGRVEVRLAPQFGGADVQTAIAAVDGSFRIAAGGGVPAGKYKIVVLALEPALHDAPTETGEVDLLEGAFSQERTPLVRDIGPGSRDLGVIDLNDYP